MRASDENDLIRALGGDATARLRLAERASGDPELASEIERYERAWRELAPPPVAPPPPGFAARVAARASAERRVLPGLPLSPAWASALAAALVAVGVAGGAGLGLYAMPETQNDVTAVETWPDSGQSLADEYLTSASAPSGDTAAASSTPTEGR